MAIKNNKISTIIEEQIPDFIKEDHDNFVQFLKSYYEFLESEDPPTRLSLVVDNPDPSTYTSTNPYGGKFQIGETLQQKANSDRPTEVTASAKVFALPEEGVVAITSFGGTNKSFVKNVEIIGVKSGVKFFAVEDTESLRAGATRASLDLLDTKDIDSTLDDYVQYIKNEFAVNLPLSLHENTDTRKALKNIREFYKARGTENSFKFLFRLLYGEDISIYLPETDMLRASDANWKNVTIIRVRVESVDPKTFLPVTSADLAGRKIKGLNSEASAIVEKVTDVIYAGSKFTELEISDKLGTFFVNESIETDNVGDGTSVVATVLGLMNTVNITDPGSNYVVGDRVVINSESGVGAIAEVATTNATSGAITSIKIVDPGYDYTSAPTLDITAPHNADAGAARFEAGPLETIYYNDFSQYTDANSFFAESDKRGANSLVGSSVGHPYDSEAYSLKRGYLNPASVTPNSIFNFTTVPGVDEGLKGYWKMNSYYPKDVTINTADATANDSNDPVANNGLVGGHSSDVFRGPRVGDITFVADPNHDTMLSVLNNNINYSYTNAMSVPDRTGANTYLSTGWTGFQPVVYDESGHGHHAYLTVGGGGERGATSTINVRSEVAFANVGVLGAGSNSLGTFGEGAIVLMPHDDIRNANTQSWVFWYNPLVHDETAIAAAYNSKRRIITRDRSQYWSICANGGYSASGMGTTERDDILFHFVGGVFDTGGTTTDVKLANSSGYFPGGPGQINDAAGVGGILKLNTWNMIALTIDYNDQGAGRGVGNVYVFNTDDGLVVANGFSFPVNQDANTTSSGWEVTDGLIQGRAVLLGENCESANGDTFDHEDAVNAQGEYDEVRYYDKALSWPQVESLFYNPGGRFDGVLSGDWKALPHEQGGTNFYSSSPTTVEFIKDEVYEYDASDGDGTTGGEKLDERVSYAGGGYLRVGNADGVHGDGLGMWTAKNISFDPTVRYKISVRAKDGSDSTTSNAVMGLMGISNTGLNIIGSENVPRWINQYKIVQSQSTNTPDYASSLGPGWFTYSGVYGGNTSISGWSDSYVGSNQQAGHGGNTAQAGTGPQGSNPFGLPSGKRELTWAHPAHVWGDPTHATSNVAFVRPTILLNYSNQHDSTYIDYIKIEQQKDAILTAQIGSEFKQVGEYLDDSGKIGTSTTSSWRQKYIQDDKFYQIYSYVIKSGLSIGTYKEVVNKLVHPAGLIMFGQVNIESLVSVAMKAFDRDDVFLADVVELLRVYYMGAESSLLSDYAGVSIGGYGVGYKTVFGLNNVGVDDFNLDAAHGVTPHGAGPHTQGSPGWIAWDQSPLTSPYANSHYYTSSGSSSHALINAPLWPYEGADLGEPPYATSNAYTTVTDNSLIWNIKGWRTMLVPPFENAYYGALESHANIKLAQQSPASVPSKRQYGWGRSLATSGASTYAPLDIDGGVHRYVRMKIRRIGPGGYGPDSWLGVCQPDTNPGSNNRGGSFWRPTLDLTPTDWNNPAVSIPGMVISVPDRSNPDKDALFYASANTAQPSTLINSSTASPNAKSPWHILEWDMHVLGEAVETGVTYPKNGMSDMWKDATATTGTSPQDGGPGRRIGSMSFQLCYEPDNGDEKFEIEWIQVDDGTGWPRGSYALPAGSVTNTHTIVDSSGAGTGGIPSRIRTSESSDFSNQTIGDFSVTVAPAATDPSEISTGAPVLYVHSDKIITSYLSQNANDNIFDSNGAIFRASANTANNLDWVITEIIDSEKFLRNASGSPALGDYVGTDLTANGKFSGPVILDTDVNDNLYVGYVYEDEAGGYSRFDSVDDSKPLMLFRLTPTDDIQDNLSTMASPYNLRARSNTYSAEQILWGNTGGTEGVGVMVGGNHLYGVGDLQWTNIESGGGSGSFVDFSTDDLGSLYIVGSGSQNIIKILPAANTSYANGVTKIASDLTGQLHGRSVYELANTTTIDADGFLLNNWRPTNIIPGPKDSMFVACDTGAPIITNLTDTAAGTTGFALGAYHKDEHPSWSPDGTKIIFTTSREVDSSGQNGAIYVMDADDGGNQTLVQNEVVGAGGYGYPAELYDPAWSPDGSKIAFVTIVAGDKEIWTMDADGDLTSMVKLAWDGSINQNPAWSPDGTKIAWESTRDSLFGATGGSEIWMMDASDGGNKEQVTDRASDYMQCWEPTWSPDGTKIAFSTHAWGTGQKRLAYVNVSDVPNITGSDFIQLTDISFLNDEYPAWSPDGREIAFQSNRDTGTFQTELFIVNVNTLDVSKATTQSAAGVSDKYPAWSPDGSQLTFSSNRENDNTQGDLEIFKISRYPSWRLNNSVYCYHIVTEQNLATGEYYAKNVYPVFANTQSFTIDSTSYATYLHPEGASQSCAGMVLDHEEPPNLYYMSANTMYRIKPKGYSYHMGDTEIEQVFPDNYFRDTLNYHGGSGDNHVILGHAIRGVGETANPYIYYQNNYQTLQVDSRNRIYFGGMANLFCYSRGSNTSGPDNDGLPLYNQSNTEFSTLQVVANSQMYTSNIDFSYGSETASISNFVLGARTSNSAFNVGGGGGGGTPSAPAKIYWSHPTGERINRADADGENSNVENVMDDDERPGEGWPSNQPPGYGGSTGAREGGGQALNNPNGIALDIPNGKIYWVDRTDDIIQRADFAGTDVGDFPPTETYLDYRNIETVVTAAEMAGPVGDLKLDLVNRRVYWTDLIGSGAFVRSASMDGTDTSVENIYNAFGVESIDLDVTNQQIYMMGSNGIIRRKDMDDVDPSSATLVIDLGASVQMALDLENDKIYYTKSAGSVGRCNLDGSAAAEYPPFDGSGTHDDDWIGNPDFGTGRAIAIDSDGGYAYFSDVSSTHSEKAIYRKLLSAASAGFNADGSTGIETVVSHGGSDPDPRFEIIAQYLAIAPATSSSSTSASASFSEGVYITMHDGQPITGTGAGGGPPYTNENGRRLVAVYPNANGSFVTDEGGQLAMTIMDEDPAANTKFELDGTGTDNVNKFRGKGPGKVVLRPEKV